jgi:hypothetical protein
VTLLKAGIKLHRPEKESMMNDRIIKMNKYLMSFNRFSFFILFHSTLLSTLYSYLTFNKLLSRLSSSFTHRFYLATSGLQNHAILMLLCTYLTGRYSEFHSSHLNIASVLLVCFSHVPIEITFFFLHFSLSLSHTVYKELTQVRVRNN